MNSWTATVEKIHNYELDKHDDTTKRPLKLNKREEKVREAIYRAWIILFHEKTYSPTKASIEHSNRERITVKQAMKHVEAAILIFNDPFTANREAEKAILRDVALRNMALAEQEGKHAAVTKYLSILTKLGGFDRPEPDKIDLTKNQLPALVAGQTDKEIVQELPDDYEVQYERIIMKKQKEAQITQKTINIDSEDD